MPEASANDSQDTRNQVGWMSDVQRAIALILIGTLASLTFVIGIRIVILGDAAALVDNFKTLQSNLTNMALITLGFFFGNTLAKMTQDAGQQKVVDKLTSSPVAPVPSPPAAPQPFWNRMTDAERAAIAAEGPNDPKIAAFIAAPVSEKPNPDDLAYLVTKGLLTQERATALQS